MTKMRAYVVHKPGSPLVAEERDLPSPGPGEVRIQVHACGVCHSDAVTVEGLFPGLAYPRIPGHEVIGVIDELGPEVRGWSVGGTAAGDRNSRLRGVLRRVGIAR